MTQADVGAHAGVSPSTVSLVLNGLAEHIPAATRERVENSARELNYRTNRFSTFLFTGTRHAIGVMFPLGNSEAVPMVTSLARLVRPFGYQVEAVDSGVDAEEELQAFRSIVESGVDAIVRAGTHAPDEAQLAEEMTETHISGLPVVTVNYPLENSPVPFVAARQEVRGQIAVRHLIEQGITKIGWVDGPQYPRSGPSPPASLRYRGYQFALHEASLEPAFHVSPEIEQNAGDYGHLIRSVLSAKEPEAVIANVAEQGAHVLQIAHEMGLHVPNDLAVVAIGAGPICDFVYPAMTSVGRPPAAYAEALGQILADVLGSPSAWDGRGITVEPELIIRDSSIRTDTTTADPDA